MFNGNVTQTYNFQDASYEIIFMLLGAFLLGSLLTWLLHKLFNRDYSVENNAYRYEHQGNDEINTLKQSHPHQAQTTGEVRIVDKPSHQQPKIVSAPDDLTKISGIDANMQTELSKFNIKSYADLRDIDTQDLKAIQNNKLENKRVIETWPHQASLAAKGDWNKLKDYQGFIQRVQVASNTPEETEKPSIQEETKDELTKIVGIDSTIEKILNKKEIKTYKQLSHIDGEILKSHLTNEDSKYDNYETDSWSHQAAMADKEQWEELKVYQDFMHSESESVDSNIDNTKDTSRKYSGSNITSLRSEKANIESLPDNEDENLSDHDDLKKIEGIGPKIEAVLNDGGIYTYSQLYNSNRNRLRQLLDEAGSQFRMHNPDSWPHQAGMANRSEWDELATYQHSLIKEQALKAKQTAADRKSKNNTRDKQKVSRLTTTSKKDDLRKIEGIGPKIEELLNKAGIATFKDLSESSRDAIKELLNEAGPQFRMHEPESWPHQAKLASNGEWQELKEYQEFLSGGRE